ncbi:MAG TPA: cytochrome c oxidase assembly protein, partial [Azospirillum sp.]
HMLLMAVAAPLFVAAAPLPPLLAGLPAGWGRRLARRWNTAGALPALWSWLTRPLVAFLLQAAAIWVWHAPAPYQAALGDGFVHDAEHLTFLGTALLFWWSAVHGRGTPAGRALGVLAVFGTLLHTGLLGALMTFAPNPWYPAYGAAPLAWGLTPLEDQQLAGLVMWVPGGLLYLGAGLLLLGRRILRAGPAPARPIPPAAGRGRAGWRSPPPACG